MSSRLAVGVATSMVAMASMVACGGGEGVPVAEDARFTVARAEGSIEDVADVEAWRDAVPFKVVLPASLPDGVQVIDALVMLPVAGLDPRTTAGASPATLILRDGTSREVVVAQTLAREPRPSRPTAGVALDLEGAEQAELFEGLGGPDDASTLLVWRACDRDFTLATGDGTVMPREEVLDLARAFIEGCES